MTNRLIKEAYVSSPRITACSPGARDLWVRIVLRADDYGLFEAVPMIVAARCYPNDMPEREEVEVWLNELEKQRLIMRYTEPNTDRAYLILCQWHVMRVRQIQPLYPPPPEEVIRKAGAVLELFDWVNAKAPKRRKGLQGVRSLHNNNHKVDSPLLGEVGVLPSGKSAANLYAKRADHFEGGGLSTTGGSGQPEVDIQKLTPRARARLRASNLDKVLTPPTAEAEAAREEVDSPLPKSLRGNGEHLTFNPETRKIEGFTDDQARRWQETFPELALWAEVDRASLHLSTHPERLAEVELDIAGWLSAWIQRSLRMKSP